MIYLVGAGTGDSGLVTVKGLRCIEKADVIIYDRLVNPTLLGRAKDGCKLIYVGKKAGSHYMKQEEINSLLLQCAEKYETIVRLKGGDPFIFGRGGEEAEEIAKHGIEYEIVPGVSSCFAVPAYCGIPVTHRGVAPSFHVITGHEKNGSDTVDYAALAKLSGTLVFLMGLGAVSEICDNLISGGKSADTPSCVISNGTTQKQRAVFGTLSDIADKAKELSSPAVVVVGDVINIRRSWFEPLGVKILTVGTHTFNKNIRAASAGMDVTELQIIKVLPINYDLFVKTDIGAFSHIAFTSANGADLFFEYMKSSGMDIRALKNVKFAAVGKKTADAISARGIFTDIIPKKHNGREMAKALIEEKCDNVLLVRAQNGADTIPDMLTESGVRFTDLKLYKTETDTKKRELINLCALEADYIIISSGSAAKAFSSLMETDTCAKLISVGEETTKTAEKYGLDIYRTSKMPDAESVMDCIKNDMEEK